MALQEPPEQHQIMNGHEHDLDLKIIYDDDDLGQTSKENNESNDLNETQEILEPIETMEYIEQELPVVE